MIYWPTKAPSDEIDYGMAWGPTLGELGDPPPTIIEIGTSWQVVSGDVDILASVINADGQGTVVRLGGGTDGSEAILRNIIKLSDGQSLHEEAFIKVRAL